LPAQRREYALALIVQRRWITISELSNELQVSAATVRRDLALLARQRLIMRVHGGVGRTL